jgi:hypothetical protein
MTKPAQRAARRGIAKAKDRAPTPRLTQAAAIERMEGRFGNEVVKSQKATRAKRPASKKVTFKAMATIRPRRWIETSRFAETAGVPLHSEVRILVRPFRRDRRPMRID